MDTIWTGAARFNKTESQLIRHMMAKLVRDGQKPQALFITCADSRIVPSTITASGPGDLFTMRNIGNLVPAYDGSLGAAQQPSDLEPSMGAALAYAIEVLEIPSIIVCGHSDCGAMKAVASGDLSKADLHLQVWLTHAAESASRLEAGEAFDTTLSRHDQLAQINAVQQAANLTAYPVVARALAEGRVQVHAWYFELAQAEVQVYDAALGRFVRLEEANVLDEHEARPAISDTIEIKPTPLRKSLSLEAGGLKRDTERSTLNLAPAGKGEDKCA